MPCNSTATVDSTEETAANDEGGLCYNAGTDGYEYDREVARRGLKAVPSTCDTNQFWYLGDFTKSGTSYTWTNKNLCTNIEP